MTAIFILSLLRAGATLLSLQGQAKGAAALTAIGDAYEAGQSIDAYMADIAAQLDAGNAASWDDIAKRIEDAEAKFLSAE